MQWLFYNELSGLFCSWIAFKWYTLSSNALHPLRGLLRCPTGSQRSSYSGFSSTSKWASSSPPLWRSTSTTTQVKEFTTATTPEVGGIHVNQKTVREKMGTTTQVGKFMGNITYIWEYYNPGRHIHVNYPLPKLLYTCELHPRSMNTCDNLNKYIWTILVTNPNLTTLSWLKHIYFGNVVPLR